MKKISFLPSEKISIKKVQDIIPGISKTTAHRYIRLAKEGLCKNEKNLLTVNEFAQYMGIKSIN